MALLDLKEVTMRFGGLTAVNSFNLNLEKGELAIEGLITELVYSDDQRYRDRGKSFFERIFK